MKNFAVMLLLWLGVSQASAQVTVELLFDQEMYLPHETLMARVRVANSSGQTLKLGEQADWLQFVVEKADNSYARELRTADVSGAFVLESSHTATKRVDLSKAFDISELGRYKVTATVKVPAFAAQYASAAKAFTITRGTKIWNTTFGVPSTVAGAEPGRPEIRQYHLLQSNLKDELRLYVRLTDERENVIKIIPIGRLVSFSRPEPQLDRWSNLHVLYQKGARDFSYTVINPDGLMIGRETHFNTETRPSLVVNDEGRIHVKGGVRKVTREDLPPPLDSEIAPEYDFAAVTLVDPAPGATNATNNAKAPEADGKRKKKSTDAKEKKNR